MVPDFTRTSYVKYRAKRAYEVAAHTSRAAARCACRECRDHRIVGGMRSECNTGEWSDRAAGRTERSEPRGHYAADRGRGRCCGPGHWSTQARRDAPDHE